jgi:Putative addiction module component
MAVAAEKIVAEALGLPRSGRVLLVGKLLNSLSGEADPTVEHAHLNEIRRRRKAVNSGAATLVDGDHALQGARAALRQ